MNLDIDIPDLDDIKFEETCGLCHGTHQYERWEPLPRERDKAGKLKPERRAPQTFACTYCDKDGLVLTGAGKTLLAFLNKYSPSRTS